MNENTATVIEVLDGRVDADVGINHKVIRLLVGRLDLMGIILHLALFARYEPFFFRNQKEIAQKMGLSEPTFKIKRDELIKMGILSMKMTNRRLSYKLHTLNEESDKPLFISTQEVETKKEIKAEVVKFPNADYILVLEAFNKAKGIELAGPEIARAKHAVKQMFLANRKPEQIVACIEFFASKQNHEQYQWLRHWTLETVMKKMPEFVAGKLKLFQIGDDLREL